MEVITGQSAGSAVIDSVRAAQNLPLTRLAKSAEWIVKRFHGEPTPSNC
jgi:hypothetical protein